MRRQVKAALVGLDSDPNFTEAFDIARVAQRNFEPLWRCFLTSTSGVESEEELLQTQTVYRRAQHAFTVEGKPIVKFLRDGGVGELRRYLQDKLLVDVVCKQLNMKGIPLRSHHLSIQPVFYEPTRQATYIISVMGINGTTVICIDPTIEVASSIDVVDIVMQTHTPCDSLSGTPLLMSRFSRCTEAIDLNFDLADGLSLQLSKRNCPGFTLDSCNIEIGVSFGGVSTTAAVLLCPTIGLDGLSRVDFMPSPRKDAISVLHASMLDFKERHLNQESAHVTLLSSRGGYNVCNSQLEAFWGTSVTEVLRKDHVRPLWKAVTTGVEAFEIYYNTFSSPLPYVGGGTSIYRMNTSPKEQFVPFGTPKLTVDLRDPSSFFNDPYNCNAVNIPLDDPPTKPDAKKAEIWLSCVVSPNERVRMVFPEGMPSDVVYRRLLHIGIQEGQVERITTREVRGESGASVRLSSYSGLKILDDVNTLVVDIRTTEEFRNGSHVRSIHYPLSDLLRDWQEDCTGGAILEGLFRKAYENTKMTSFSVISLYCAGGYRSHIAASLLRSCEQFSHRPVNDVSGGAFQLMTQRPDMWHVKDRSILCIS